MVLARRVAGESRWFFHVVAWFDVFFLQSCGFIEVVMWTERGTRLWNRSTRTTRRVGRAAFD